MLYSGLLDKNGYLCETLINPSHPVVLLQRGESRGDRFVESLSSDLNGVLNVLDILHGDCACSENHAPRFYKILLLFAILVTWPGRFY